MKDVSNILVTWRNATDADFNRQFFWRGAVDIVEAFSTLLLRSGLAERISERGQSREFHRQFKQAVHQRHAIVIAGDQDGFQNPDLAHQALVVALRDLKALTPGVDAVIVMEDACACIESIRAAANRWNIPIVQLTRHRPDSQSFDGGVSFWLPETVVWDRSRPFPINDDRKELILDAICEAASGKSMLLLPGNPQSCFHVRAARDDGFTVMAFKNAPATRDASFLDAAGTSRLPDDTTEGVLLRRVYSSPLATEIEKYVKGKATVAFVTSQETNYVDKLAVSKAMFDVGKKLGIQSAAEARHYAIVCREDAGACQSGSSFAFASEMRCDCVYIYSHDAIEQPAGRNPNCYMIRTGEFPRSCGVEAVGMVCSEVLGIASQVNEGEKQIMVIFGASSTGAGDAFNAAREGHIVIVLEEHYLEPACKPENATDDWKPVDEYAMFHARRAELEAKGVRFYKNADEMPEVRWPLNSSSLDE